MGLFGKKKILECTCGCGCPDYFEKYGFIIKGKKEYDYRRYGKIWKGDYTICVDCNEGKHAKATKSANSSKEYDVTIPNRELSITYEKLQGLLTGISDEEFEILLKLSFWGRGLKIYEERRKIMSSNDLVLSLMEYDEDDANYDPNYIYVAHIDRTKNEYSTTWIDKFLQIANTSKSHFGHCKEIFILNINENSIKYELPKKSDTKQTRDIVQLFLGKKFIKFIFRDKLENRVVFQKLYPHENQMWDAKSQDEQSNFCEQNKVEYIQYNRLWKYPLHHQCMLIFALNNLENKTSQQKNTSSHDANDDNSEDQSEMSLEKAFKILALDSTSTPEEIKKSFKSLSLKWHSDKQSLNSKRHQLAEDIMKEINIAYQYLKSEGIV